jgi:pyrrolidone-carboxylate peptidase
VFYGLMDGLRRRSATRGGFIHVPLPRDDGMTLAVMVRAIESVIATTLATPTDIALSGGAVD